MALRFQRMFFCAFIATLTSLASTHFQSVKTVQKKVVPLKSCSVIFSLAPSKGDLKAKGIWGSEERGKLQIQEMARREDGEMVPFRASAFLDLRDIHQIDRVGPDRIKIVGGDASTSFRCFLEFRKGELYKRRVESGEFPNHHCEETVYTNLDPGG